MISSDWIKYKASFSITRASKDDSKDEEEKVFNLPDNYSPILNHHELMTYKTRSVSG